MFWDDFMGDWIEFIGFMKWNGGGFCRWRHLLINLTRTSLSSESNLNVPLRLSWLELDPFLVVHWSILSILSIRLLNIRESMAGPSPRLQLASMLEFQFAPQAPEEGAYEGSSEWLDSEAVQQWLQTAGLRVSQWQSSLVEKGWDMMRWESDRIWNFDHFWSFLPIFVLILILTIVG